MSRPALSLSDYRALAEFRYQIRAFLSFSERASRSQHIEPQQHQLLLACKGLPQGSRATIGTLAQRLCVEHHTAVALVDKLEASEFVHRERNPADGREVLVRITRRGEAVLEALSALHREQLAEVGPKLIAALADIVARRD